MERPHIEVFSKRIRSMQLHRSLVSTVFIYRCNIKWCNLEHKDLILYSTWRWNNCRRNALKRFLDFFPFALNLKYIKRVAHWFDFFDIYENGTWNEGHRSGSYLYNGKYMVWQFQMQKPICTYSTEIRSLKGWMGGKEDDDRARTNY